MTFDTFFQRLVRLTGWGIGIYAVAADKLDATQTVALVIAFVGFEFIARKRDRVLESPDAEKTKPGG